MLVTVKINVVGFGSGYTVDKFTFQDEDAEWNAVGEEWTKIAREKLGETCEWVHRKNELFGGYYRNTEGICVVME
jgi:hypothetical protein